MTAEAEAAYSSDGASGTAVDVMVCSVGHKNMAREKLSLARELWAAGMSADIMHDNALVSKALFYGCIVE